MLNLSRTVGDAVRIGDDIEVYVERITGNRVRLGFKAPREVAIYRDEVYRKRATARDAAGGAVTSEVDASGTPHRRPSVCPHPARVRARLVSRRQRVPSARPRPRVAGRERPDR